MHLSLLCKDCLMDGVAGANKDQVLSLTEVNNAVRQRDGMTLHNAALVEATNAPIE
ncbi:hypothetical protein [Devosia soli]|uniref:hypothetical protein n=1 Tax=Devosia soli TaxID=361041 RepID=UPI000AA78416|nr:hypothetical protein [Devosia soli]